MEPCFKLIARICSPPVDVVEHEHDPRLYQMTCAPVATYVAFLATPVADLISGSICAALIPRLGHTQLCWMILKESFALIFDTGPDNLWHNPGKSCPGYYSGT